MKFSKALTVAALVAGVSTALLAQQATTAAEVRKVDLDQGKVTLKHEDIKNLDMPAMTMVFRVTRPEQLKALKAGDKVRFHAEKNGSAIVVTDIAPAK